MMLVENGYTVTELNAIQTRELNEQGDLINSGDELRELPVGTIVTTDNDELWRISPAGQIMSLQGEGQFDIEDIEEDEEFFPILVMYIPQY
jgi:hypothetical protein